MKKLTFVTTDGAEHAVQSKRVETTRWADGVATLTILPDAAAHPYESGSGSTPTSGWSFPSGGDVRVAMDRAQWNALVADWALSAPGRTANRRFAIRANARAGRLRGDEADTDAWARNKSEAKGPPCVYGRPPVGRPAKDRP